MAFCMMDPDYEWIVSMWVAKLQRISGVARYRHESKASFLSPLR